MKVKATKDELLNKLCLSMEQRIKLVIKPKPKWLPKFLWYKLLKKIIVIKYFKQKESEK